MTAAAFESTQTRQGRAARYYGVGDIRVEQVDVPAPGPGEITIKVALAGICGTDLHEYFSAQTATPLEPHPLTGAQIPVVLGHEFSGTVVACGAGVTNPKVGDRVAVQPTYSCGTCGSCSAGFPNSCYQLALHGISAHGGGLSDFTTVAASMAFVLPDSVTLQQGALVEPMAVSRHGVTRGLSHGFDGVAFVGGAGVIGLGAVVALRDAGVDTIIVSDLSDTRRESALAVGASEVFDPRVTDLATSLAGRRLGLAVEAAGSGAVVDSAIQSLGVRGTLVLLGVHERPMELNPTLLLLREVAMCGSCIYVDDDFSEVIGAMARGSYDNITGIETRTFEDLHGSFEDLRSGSVTKIMIDPSA